MGIRKICNGSAGSIKWPVIWIGSDRMYHISVWAMLTLSSPCVTKRDTHEQVGGKLVYQINFLWCSQLFNFLVVLQHLAPKNMWRSQFFWWQPPPKFFKVEYVTHFSRFHQFFFKIICIYFIWIDYWEK